MLFRTSLGIEIAGKDLRIAVLRSVLGKLRFERALEIRGFLDLSPEEQKASITQLARTQKLPSAQVYLTLSQDRGIVRQIEFPVEVREKLKSAVTLQIETLCPWPIEEIYWDFTEETPSKGAKTVTATIVMIPRAALDPWIEFFEAVKLPLSGASLSSLSCAHAVRALWADNKPAMVLDCETAYVEGALVQDHRITSITQAEEDATSAAKSAAERLLSIGRVGSPENVRLIAYGPNAASIESVDRVALPIENSKLENSERFGAIAAALLGLKETAFRSNLIPREHRYRRNQLQLIPTYALIVLTLLFGLAMAARAPYQTMVYASRLDAEIRKIAPEVREVSSQEAELNKLSEQYRALAAHLRNHDYNLEVLRELSRSLPATAFLTSYTCQDGAVSVSGFAASASEVQKVLEDSVLFKDVQFTSSVTRDARGQDRFTLKASVESPQ